MNSPNRESPGAYRHQTQTPFIQQELLQLVDYEMGMEAQSRQPPRRVGAAPAPLGNPPGAKAGTSTIQVLTLLDTYFLESTCSLNIIHITMHQRMRYDDVSWERSEAEFEAWCKKLYQQEVLREIGNFMAKHRGGVPKELFSPIAGAFSVCLRMEFGDGGSAILRFPQPGNVRFPEEKLLKEVAVMRYVAENTLIPLPFVLHYGMTDESPAGMGPFILMEHITHEQNVTAALNTPGFVREDRPILNPEIPETKLKFIYSQMADVLLRLSQPSFDQIGSIGEDGDGRWSITDRPMTFNMNELVSLGNFPPAKLPSTTFTTSSSYFAALADVNLIHLSTQRNDAIDSAEDCRRKYVARHLFRKLAREGHLSSAPSLDPKPFRLFCDDLRPSNVLIDAECRIVGVIDWEFSYAAPAEFTYSPPWWLLIETPEKWPKGVSDWAK